MRMVSTAAYCAFVVMCLISVSAASQVGLGADPLGGWGDAELLEYMEAGDADRPVVSADALGNAIVVWEQWDGYRHSIWGNRYVYNEGWGPAERLDSTMVENALTPHVDTDGSGNAVAVWQQFDGVRYNMWSNRYVVGEGWGTPQTIETHSEDAGPAQVVVDPSGNATAVWVQLDSGHLNIWSNRYVVGEGWGTAGEIEGFPDESHALDLAGNDNGNVVAVWSQWDGFRFNVSSNRYVVEEGWGTAELIATNDSGEAGEPRVTVDSSGNATAVWLQWGDGVYDVWSNRFVVGAGWGAAERLDDYDTGDAVFPRVADDGSGNVVAVWQQMVDSTYHIWSKRYTAGEGWGAAELIETDPLTANIPLVTVDRSGNATAVWTQSDGTRNTVSACRYIVGEGWGLTELVSADDAGSTSYSSVSAGGFGDVFVAWMQSDSIRFNICANQYIIPDLTPPMLTIDSPSDGLTTETPTVTVSGTTEPGVSLSISGIWAVVEADGSFSCAVALVEGANAITATATDVSNNSATASVNVTYVNPVPALEAQLADALADLAALQDQLDDALVDLALAQAQLDAALDDVAGLEDELAAALADLVLVEAQLDAAQDDLAAVEAQLEAALGDLDALQMQLDDAQANLTAAEDDLSGALEDLAAVQEELDAAQEDLGGASDDLDDARSQNLLLSAALGVCAVLAVVMAVMFLSLRKKVAGAKTGGPGKEEP